MYETISLNIQCGLVEVLENHAMHVTISLNIQCGLVKVLENHAVYVTISLNIQCGFNYTFLGPTPCKFKQVFFI